MPLALDTRLDVRQPELWAVVRVQCLQTVSNPWSSKR
jgi:hypothetical protein